jgi:signal transduction histidine kinase
MLRRLKVRTRLITVIAVPLVLLLVVAVPEALQRRDSASTADTAAELAGLATDVAAAVDALQSERTLSSAWRAGARDEIGTTLADQRAVTDAATARAAAALLRTRQLAPSLADATALATDRLGTIADVRAQTDAAQSIVPWVDPFGPVLDALLAIQEDLGSVVSDAGVGNELTQVGLLARTKEAAAAQAAQLAAATTWDGLRGDQRGILTSLRGDELAYRTAYLAATPSADRVVRRTEVQQGPVTSADRIVDEVIVDGDVSNVGGLQRWLGTAADRQVVLRDVESARAADALHAADDLGSSSRRALTAYAALAGIGLLVALALALLAARSITRPLRRLTEAADDLAEERLPKLVDALRNPGDNDESYLAATMAPIEVRSDDELAHLGRAFNAVQAVAVDVAAQQAELLRKGISDLYVNLARRNQSLIERQINLLDRLEAGEQDPEVLEHLFQLDHLATRMRRNAESLLVLAGGDGGGPRRSRSIDVVDVVRAALSEVEDYERVDLGSLAAATVEGPAVSDVAHLVAELLENATQFSPPDTTVRIDGIRTGGSYQLVVSDNGVGMSPAQVDELNAILRDPPVTGLALGRSLGCLVAARLAARHDITVRLRTNERGGVTAFVVLPRHLITDDEVFAPSSPPLPPVPVARPANATLAALEEQVPVAPVMPVVPHVDLMPGGAPSPGEALPSRLRDVLPVAAEFDAGLQSLLGHDPEQSPASLVEPPVSSDERDERDEPAESTPQSTPQSTAQSTPDRSAEAPAPTPVDTPTPAAADVRQSSLAGTVAPVEPSLHALVRRVPGASAEHFASAPQGERVRRSPDEVRSLLSRYRSGLHAGRAGDSSLDEEER